MFKHRRSSMLLFLACGCGGTYVQYAPLGASDAARPARAAESVQVYSTARPDRAYADVGLLDVRQRGAWGTRDVPGLIAAVREEAGRRGCDALIVQGPHDTVNSITLETADVYTHKGYSGACIVYTEAARSGLP
jgi:hypothetical protein